LRCWLTRNYRTLTIHSRKKRRPRTKTPLTSKRVPSILLIKALANKPPLFTLEDGRSKANELVARFMRRALVPKYSI
jgi:hypothetical protein